jgi:hypothetical protein
VDTVEDHVGEEKGIVLICDVEFSLMRRLFKVSESNHLTAPLEGVTRQASITAQLKNLKTLTLQFRRSNSYIAMFRVFLIT